MVITSIEKNNKNKNKLSVFVDGHYSFSILEEEYIGLNLYELKEITTEQIAYIQTNINAKSAKIEAVRSLSLKVRSAAEIRAKLENSGYSAEVIDSVLDDLTSIGYINDKMFAQKFLYDRSKLKPISKKMMAYELQKKGISQEIIEDTINNWEIDDQAVAEGLVNRKFGKYDLRDPKIFKKATSFLKHRGFSYDVIRQTINQLVSDKM